jgi:hypothetical protein
LRQHFDLRPHKTQIGFFRAHKAQDKVEHGPCDEALVVDFDQCVLEVIVNEGLRAECLVLVANVGEDRSLRVRIISVGRGGFRDD